MSRSAELKPEWRNQKAADLARLDMMQRGWECSDVKAGERNGEVIWWFSAKRDRLKTFYGNKYKRI